jgi:transposase
MARYDLTDFKWLVIKALLPNKPRGVRRVDARQALRPGTHATGYNRFRRWTRG